MVSEQFANKQLSRLSGTLYWDRLESAAITELVKALQGANSDAICAGAVSNLLQDLTERPTVSQIIRAVASLNEADRQPVNFAYCGKLVEGKTFLSHHPRTECTADEQALLATPPKFLIPSRCVRGWVHWTAWIPVVPAMIDDDGQPITQPYEYSARCKCQPGGVI
jgi:hypothetical protein